MSQFHTLLATRDLSDDLYMMIEDLIYDSDVLRARIIVPAGFVFDRMSIKRWMPVVYQLLGNRAGAAGAGHDFCYQKQLYPRRLCDAVLPEMMACLGQSWAAQQAAWAGVRIGGHWSYASGPRRFRMLQAIQMPPVLPGDLA